MAMPHLSERQADLPDLIKFLLRGRNEAGQGSQAIEIDQMAEQVLLAYDWPGNVRELENVINRARILADDKVVSLEDLPQALILKARGASSEASSSEADGYLRNQLRRFESDIIARAVRDAGGDRKLAADRLGIGLSSLYRKLEETDR